MDRVNIPNVDAFKHWLIDVDIACTELCGLSTADLPDCDYWKMWDEGLSPLEAAGRAIKNAGAY